MQLERYIAAVLSRRWLVVVLATLVMLAMTAGARFITVTNDYRVLFSEDNPQLAAFDALENTYSVSNAALIAIAPRDGSVFTREALVAIEELTEAAWRAPYSSRVNSLTNYTHSEAFEDDLVVAPLVEDASVLSDADVVRIEEIALDAIEIAGRLVAHDGRTAGVAINFILPENPDQAVVEITDYLNSILAEARANHPDIDYYMTGDVVMHRAFSDVTKSDMETLTPIVFLIIVGATIILLRSILGTVAIVAVLVFVVNTTLGFAGWNGVVFSPTNAGVPIIVMVIAIADSIHVVTSVLLGMRRGLDRNTAIVESIRINAYPVFITSVTTAIGFLSLNASDSPPFHVLGNYVAFGVLCALVYTMTLLPALLSILPLRARRVQAEGTAFFDRFADFVIARRTFLLSSVSLVIVVLAIGIPRIELSDNMAQYFDERYEFRRDTDYVIDNLTGLDKLEYSLSAGREGGITDPDYLRKVDAFAEWYRQQPEVTHVQAFSDIMKRLNKNMHGDDPAFYRLPEDPDLAAQYLLLYELSLPFGSDLNDRIDVAKSATRLVVTTKNAWSRDIRELDKRAQGWLRANAPAFAQEASGLSVVFAHLSLRNINSMLRGTITAMVLISFILIWIFKSVRVGLLSLLPNFIPAIMSFGLWGYLVGHVGIASSVVIAVVFGIVVDDTVHFLSKYLKARREGLPAPEAVRSAFHMVGH
ncbi:MAG: MMPL family transporter, partial [Gemmatimonadetes bacterium]|nr:MMPL family transporter [Gemmatimonadota bacterium]